MDPRIGKLIREGVEVFYAHIDGRYVEGSLNSVEARLGLSRAIPAWAQPKTFSVHMTFEYPAWDERQGYYYRGIIASTKRDAIKQARRMAEKEGHAVGGRGKYWFKATEED